jgi:ATP-dependent DNA helicase RecG
MKPKPSLEKLQKFFKHEASRGYDNKAVMGGLSGMLSTWEAEARHDGLSEDVIQAVCGRLRDYEKLSPASREEVLKGIWKRIRAEEDQVEEIEIPPESEPEPEPFDIEMEASGELEELEAAEHPPRKAARAPKRKKRPMPEGPPAALDASVTVLDGVGPKNAEKLARLGIENLGDMLYHFPRRYDDYTQLKPINRLRYGEEVTVIGTVQSASSRPIHGGKSKLVEVIISDGTASLRVNWFNQPWMLQTLKEDTQVVLAGKIDQHLGRLLLTNPEWELLDEENLHTNRIVPVYPLTAKLTQRWLRDQMHKVVNYWALRVEETLPEKVLKSADLMELPEALLQVHFPDSWEELKEAQHRLAFDEIFYLQLGVLRQKRRWADLTGRIFQTADGWLDGQISRLPFRLTGAQKKALADVRADLASGHPMNRLIQGDVGSGKTVIAALAAGMVVQHDGQVAIMAPTSILAEQHFKTFSELMAGEGGVLAEGHIRLMIGATPESEKTEIRERLENDGIKVVVGTHALLEDPVKFNNFQLAIIDEQHRFGVEQRARLRAKGENPHLLVMTATPIPRSLALTIYGDLDLTVVDEKPPGREPVDTYILYPRERERAYSLIRKEIMAGRQAFVIFPLVEESEKSEARAAVEEHERLQKEVFPNLRLSLLHGRLKADEKEKVMADFRDRKSDILVSTTVVEVGVDIPNASVMVIEGANRFGLAQLHQLRGRVGRGGDRSYCLLLPDTADSAENERLAAMTETNDGFILAERDLEQRGPGQFLGTRQSGFSEMHMASLTDVRLIEKARKHAHALIADDPELTEPEHQKISQALEKLWEKGQGDIS